MRLGGRVVAVFRAHLGAEHCLPFSCEWYLVCLSFVCVPSTLLLLNALDATSSWLKALQGSTVAPVSTCLFITTFEQKRKNEKKGKEKKKNDEKKGNNFKKKIKKGEKREEK